MQFLQPDIKCKKKNEKMSNLIFYYPLTLVMLTSYELNESSFFLRYYLGVEPWLVIKPKASLYYLILYSRVKCIRVEYAGLGRKGGGWGNKVERTKQANFQPMKVV